MKFLKIITFFTLVFVFQNCKKDDTPSVNPVETPIKKDTTPIVSPDTTSLRYLALGDSYTIGQSVDESLRYPVQLSAALTQAGRRIAYTRIIARTGWTTDELATAIQDAKISDSTYNMVSLLSGVNNQYRNRDTINYRIEFENLLKQAIKFANNKPEKVFVISIPDYAFTPFGNGNPGISQGIDRFNEANLEISNKYKIKYFNITPISRNGLRDPSLVASDGLHPSGKQYTDWVDLMRNEVLNLLK